MPHLSRAAEPRLSPFVPPAIYSVLFFFFLHSHSLFQLILFVYCLFSDLAPRIFPFSSYLSFLVRFVAWLAPSICPLACLPIFREFMGA